MTLFRLNPVVACLRGGLLLATVIATPALAKPPAMPKPDIIYGEVDITRPGYKFTQLHQTTDRLILEWQDFSIGKRHTVEFVQPDASSVALNRVIGGNPSEILGRLIANGQVFLVNPAGVYFGQGAEVDVGALVATTLGISNDDFIAGRHHFSGGDALGEVVNDGQLRAGDHGYVVLAAPSVRNGKDGLISAGLGRVVLAAGDTLTLDLDDGGLIGYSIGTAGDSAVSNRGQIFVDGGTVHLDAAVAAGVASSVVNSEGLIRATGLRHGLDGGIYITGGDVTHSGGLASNGVTGGEISIVAEQQLWVDDYSYIDVNAWEETMPTQIATRQSDQPQPGGRISLIGRDSAWVAGGLYTGLGGSLYVESGDSLRISQNSYNQPSGETEGPRINDAPMGGLIHAWLVENALLNGAEVTLVSGGDIRLETPIQAHYDGGGVAMLTGYGDGDDYGDFSPPSGSLRLAIGQCLGDCFNDAGFERGDSGSIVSEIGPQPQPLGERGDEGGGVDVYDISLDGRLEILAGDTEGDVRLGSLRAREAEIRAGGDISLDRLYVIAVGRDGQHAHAAADLHGRDVSIGSLGGFAEAGEAGGDADVNLKITARHIDIDRLNAIASGAASENIIATASFVADGGIRIGDALSVADGSGHDMVAAIDLQAGTAEGPAIDVGVLDAVVSSAGTSSRLQAVANLRADGDIRIGEALSVVEAEEGSAGRYIDALLRVQSEAGSIDADSLLTSAVGAASEALRSEIRLNDAFGGDEPDAAQFAGRDLRLGQLIAVAHNSDDAGGRVANISAYGDNIDVDDGLIAMLMDQSGEGYVSLHAADRLNLTGPMLASESVLLHGGRVDLHDVSIEAGLGVAIIAGGHFDGTELPTGSLDGADINLDGVSIDAPLLLLLAGGGIHDLGDAGEESAEPLNSLVADHLVLHAGQRIDLGATLIAHLGEGGLDETLFETPWAGDIAALELLRTHTLALPDGPILRGRFSAPELRMRVDGLTGDHYQFRSDHLTLEGSAPVGDLGNLLVQITPWSAVDAFALEAGRDSEHAVTYSIDMLRNAFPGTTYLFGETGFGGDIHIGSQGEIQTRGAPNFAFIAGTVYGSHLLATDGLHLALGDTALHQPAGSDPVGDVIEETAAQFDDIAGGDGDAADDDREDTITLADGGTPGDDPDIDHESGAPAAGDCP